jgi:hypothetical protein
MGTVARVVEVANRARPLGGRSKSSRDQAVHDPFRGFPYVIMLISEQFET